MRIGAGILFWIGGTICALTHALPSLAQSRGCGSSNKYVCANYPADIGDSLCLRGTNRDPQYVREINDPDFWIIADANKVTIDDYYRQSGSACAASVVDWSKLALQSGDEVRIKKTNNNYYLDVISSKSGSSYFSSPLPLSKPAKGSRYLMASTGGANAKDKFDYFVMLLDENEGKPTNPNSKKIEKYFHIELFPSQDNPGNSLACWADRPDFVIPPGGLGLPPLTNYAKWSSAHDCGGNGIVLQEVVTGGGGEHPH